MDTPRQLRYATLTLCLVGLMMATTGCPPKLNDTAKVVTVLAWDASPVKADVPNDDIQNLWVLITKITLVPVEPEEEEQGDRAEGHVTVFDAEESTPIDVDLKDLTGVSALISTAGVPVGVYNQIRLSIEEPLMVLADLEKAEYTNIHLTANSRLFITGEFEIPEGEVVIQLDFSGVKIVETGNGDYTWTPQLRALIDAPLVEAITTGTIGSGSLDIGADTFTLLLTDGSIFVDYLGAEIYDTDTTLVNDSYLAEGQTVEVAGILVGDVLTASSIWILP